MISMVYSTTTIYLQNPSLGDGYKRTLPHATGRSAGGQLYRYSKGVDYRQVTLRFTDLRDDERSALEGFFVTTVVGPSTQFTYTDHNGNSYYAIFLNDALDFSCVDDQKDTDLTFPVGAKNYLTTLRKEPVRSVEIELELSVIP